MKLHYKNKTIEIPVRKVSELGKISGLMFKTRDTDNLLFDFDKETNMSIHSFFVFFPFLAIWLDKNNSVVDFKIVRSFRLRVKSKKFFRKLVEVPFNDKNMKIINFFVGVRKI